MMRSKRAVRALNAELNQANEAAASATEIVDRKRKAADEAAADFDSTARITRHCYGTAGKRRAPTSSPVYHPTSPVYSEVVAPAETIEATSAAEETQLPAGCAWPLFVAAEAHGRCCSCGCAWTLL